MARPFRGSKLAQRLGFNLTDALSGDIKFLTDLFERVLALAADAEAQAESADAAWSHATADSIRAKAPLSLKIALAQMRRGRDWSFEECMRAEFRIVSRVVYGEDFYEGIRAVLVDKDQKPHWQHRSLAEVTEREVGRYFENLGERELTFA